MLSRLHTCLILAVAVPVFVVAASHVDIENWVAVPVPDIDMEIDKKTVMDEQTSFGRPVRIRIPAIGVDTVLVNVGLKPDGSLDAPPGPAPAGWFSSGIVPGQPGSAVIDGHSGWRDGIRASFDHLGKLVPGDKIYLEDQKGIILIFSVQSSGKFSEKSDTTAIFHSSDGGAHLNLITCAGVWNPTAHSYADRVVVFSDLE